MQAMIRAAIARRWGLVAVLASALAVGFGFISSALAAH